MLCAFCAVEGSLKGPLVAHPYLEFPTDMALRACTPCCRKVKWRRELWLVKSQGKKVFPQAEALYFGAIEGITPGAESQLCLVCSGCCPDGSLSYSCGCTFHPACLRKVRCPPLAGTPHNR